MAVLYLDSSAVVKRYAQEVGSAWLTARTDPPSGNQRLWRSTPKCRPKGACHRIPWFPNSCLGTACCETPFRAGPPFRLGGETEFRGRAFPNRSLGTRGVNRGLPAHDRYNVAPSFAPGTCFLSPR